MDGDNFYRRRQIQHPQSRLAQEIISGYTKPDAVSANLSRQSRSREDRNRGYRRNLKYLENHPVPDEIS